jgi:hypothetical protein
MSSSICEAVQLTKKCASRFETPDDIAPGSSPNQRYSPKLLVNDFPGVERRPKLRNGKNSEAERKTTPNTAKVLVTTERAWNRVALPTGPEP